MLTVTTVKADERSLQLLRWLVFFDVVEESVDFFLGKKST